jgi:hypothetical protein
MYGSNTEHCLKEGSRRFLLAIWGTTAFGGSQLDVPVVCSRMFVVSNIDYNILKEAGTSLKLLACRIVVHQPYTVVAHNGELAVWWGFIFGDVAS